MIFVRGKAQNREKYENPDVQIAFFQCDSKNDN